MPPFFVPALFAYFVTDNLAENPLLCNGLIARIYIVPVAPTARSE